LWVWVDKGIKADFHIASLTPLPRASGTHPNQGRAVPPSAGRKQSKEGVVRGMCEERRSFLAGGRWGAAAALFSQAALTPNLREVDWFFPKGGRPRQSKAALWLPGLLPCMDLAVFTGPNALLINTPPLGSPELTRLNGLLTILQFWLSSLSPKPPPRFLPRAYLDFVEPRQRLFAPQTAWTRYFTAKLYWALLLSPGSSYLIKETASCAFR
jgi:hypothetical protein